jgi:hypothetical protein
MYFPLGSPNPSDESEKAYPVDFDQPSEFLITCNEELFRGCVHSMIIVDGGELVL